MLDFDPTRPPSTPRDASTVLVLRDAGELEIFLVRRATSQRFLGGAYVFPGGKLDEADRDEAFFMLSNGLDAAMAGERLDEREDETKAFALHVAACRETFEEAGVLLARNVSEAESVAARAELESGRPFRDVLRERNVRLDLDELVPLSRWVTPRAEARRFDARFFLARCPDARAASHDNRETIDAAWLAPRVALERELAGEIQLAPPTLATLAWLANFRTVDEAFASARSRKPPRVDPQFVEHEGAFVLALPGDPAHERTERVLDLATRFVLEDGRWVPKLA